MLIGGSWSLPLSLCGGGVGFCTVIFMVVLCCVVVRVIFITWWAVLLTFSIVYRFISCIARGWRKVILLEFQRIKSEDVVNTLVIEQNMNRSYLCSDLLPQKMQLLFNKQQSLYIMLYKTYLNIIVFIEYILVCLGKIEKSSWGLSCAKLRASFNFPGTLNLFSKTLAKGLVW